MTRNSLFALALALPLTILLAGCPKNESTPGETGPVLIYVGNSMRLPMEQCLEAYRKQNPDADVLLDFGDSGDAEAKIQLSGKGEAAVLHEPFCTMALRDGWGTKVHALANMRPTIAVAKGNPKNVKGLRDFTREDLKVGLTDARYTTSGELVQEALKAAGIQQQVMDRDPVQNRSSGFMANQVAIGSLDAATCWDAVARGHEDLALVPIEPGLLPARYTDKDGGVYADGKVTVGLIILKTSKAPEGVQKFVDFILSPAGQAIWTRNGFNPAVEAPTTRND